MDPQEGCHEGAGDQDCGSVCVLVLDLPHWPTCRVIAGPHYT